VGSGPAKILAKTRPRHFDFLPSDVRTRTFEMRGLRNNCLVFVREILSQIFNQFVPTGSAVDSSFEFPPRDHPDGQPQNRRVTHEPLSGFRCRKAGARCKDLFVFYRLTDQHLQN